MLYARIENGVVAELIDIAGDGPSLAERFHPSIVAACVPCAAGVAVGWLYANGVFSAPAQPVTLAK